MLVQILSDKRNPFLPFEWKPVTPRKVTCGIPQGSCFIIYLNKFENSFKYSRASIYADGIKRLIDDADQELLNLSEWMRVNRLSPNNQTTELMVIGHPLKIRYPNLSSWIDRR